MPEHLPSCSSRKLGFLPPGTTVLPNDVPVWCLFVFWVAPPQSPMVSTRHFCTVCSLARFSLPKDPMCNVGMNKSFLIHVFSLWSPMRSTRQCCFEMSRLWQFMPLALEFARAFFFFQCFTCSCIATVLSSVIHGFSCQKFLQNKQASCWVARCCWLQSTPSRDPLLLFPKLPWQCVAMISVP